MLVGSLESWLTEPRQLASRRAEYEARLTLLRNSGTEQDGVRTTPTPALRHHHEDLAHLVARLAAFAADPISAEAEARLETARSVVRVTVGERSAEWTAAIARIAANPKSDGLALAPQVGIVPLGPDPDSGLEEFLHYEAHARAMPPAGHGARQALGIGEGTPRVESGLVFVLVPPGRYCRGVQRSDPNGDDHDPMASPLENLALGPVAGPRGLHPVPSHSRQSARWLSFEPVPPISTARSRGPS